MNAQRLAQMLALLLALLMAACVGTSGLESTDWQDDESSLSAGKAHNVVIFYVNDETPSDFTLRPNIAYLENGVAKDWMFDGLLIYDARLEIGTVNASIVSNYIHGITGWLHTTADTVKQLRQELGDPTYRLKVYLAAPYLSGASANAQVSQVLQQFDAAGRSELQLAGLYWGYEEGTATSSSADHMRATSKYIKGLNRGLEFIWLPFFSTKWKSYLNWKNYGFTRAALQPGYAFSNCYSDRMGAANSERLSAGFSGVVFETPASGEIHNVNVGDDKATWSAKTYLDAADTYGWGKNDMNAYYLGNRINAFSAMSQYRWIYDRMYKLILQTRTATPNPAPTLPKMGTGTCASGFTSSASKSSQWPYCGPNGCEALIYGGGSFQQSFTLGDAPASVQALRWQAVVALDDHATALPYCLDVTLNGTLAATSVKPAGLAHGSPHGGPFANFAAISIDLPISLLNQSGAVNTVKVKLGCAGSSDWGVFAETQLVADCGAAPTPQTCTASFSHPAATTSWTYCGSSGCEALFYGGGSYTQTYTLNGDPAKVQSLTWEATAALDDHTTPAPYCFDFILNGVTTKANVSATNVPHGAPHGGPFTNFQVLHVELPATALNHTGTTNSLEVRLGCAKTTDWAAFQSTSLSATTSCP
jgi:hypothetical protein